MSSGACSPAGSGHGPDQLHLLLQTTADQVITASNSLPTGQAQLTGAIGKAALDALLPAWRRPRIKARTRKNPTSEYGPNAGEWERSRRSQVGGGRPSSVTP
ncbi:hypothetical protein OG585_09185 [Streptomyces sp. NBC_01340]|uniref:hypothetical protein n=1 Tax=Streptomyces sp. NBC_01340 TaxID=2903830 RepID=UPI000BE3127D|nr:hypothetical protein [Streptomyces sp. NBC_01340]WSI37441.1 hypothetical protein OG585_09185 [Streptomyces sp. NBC_01340]